MTRRIVLALLLMLAALAPTAGAHTLSVAHVDVALQPSGPAKVEIDIALRDIALTFPLDANRDDAVTWGELSALRAPLSSWVVDNVGISSPAGACTLTPTGLATRRYDDGGYATVQLSAECPSTAQLKIRYGLLFDRDPQHRALITVRQGDVVDTAIARADLQTVEIGSASSNAFADFLREGVHHILIGYDHLAFLISLLLTAALVRSRRDWTPVTRLRDALGHTLGIVTAFTLAHSITLSLAALGLVTPVSRWVEASIALSVLLAALNNIFPVVSRRLWVLGFGFGLIHGFGFAGALGELGLPQGQRLLALFAFNLGVEVGQLAVVALVLPLLYLVRRQRWYPRIAMPVLSLAIALLAGYWLVERLIG